MSITVPNCIPIQSDFHEFTAIITGLLYLAESHDRYRVLIPDIERARYIAIVAAIPRKFPLGYRSVGIKIESRKYVLQYNEKQEGDDKTLYTISLKQESDALHTEFRGFIKGLRHISAKLNGLGRMSSGAREERDKVYEFLIRGNFGTGHAYDKNVYDSQQQVKKDLDDPGKEIQFLVNYKSPGNQKLQEEWADIFDRARFREVAEHELVEVFRKMESIDDNIAKLVP
jgi:hypothetical protein